MWSVIICENAGCGLEVCCYFNKNTILVGGLIETCEWLLNA